LAEQGVEKGLRAAGASEQTIRGFRLAAVVVSFIILRRRIRSATQDAKAPSNQPAVQTGAPSRITGSALATARKEFDAAKPVAWMREAATNAPKYTAEQLARMKQGLAPIGPDGFPMEIHHRAPLAEGGANLFENFEFLSRTDHRLGRNYKLNHPNLP